MTKFHGTASMGAIALALTSATAFADTKISSDTTTALNTSTAGNVEITNAGSITLNAGTALTGVTVNSNSTVLVNGDILVKDGNNNTGITVNAGTTSDIHVDDDGTITVRENYSADHPDDYLAIDSGVASGTNRYGILVAGTATGTLNNEGVITVEGQNSGGIVVNGTWTGDITTSGAIRVFGDNSVGLSTQAVNGDVTVEGTVAVVGNSAQAVNIGGDVSGTVTIQGTVTRGYTYTNDDGEAIKLTHTGLDTGTSAVQISGNVAGGVYVAAAPVKTDADNCDSDCDNDGTTDTEEGTGAITSYGNGPALQIGDDADIEIGAVTSNIQLIDSNAAKDYSLAIEGTVTAQTVYTESDATAVVIGTTNSHVTLTDGIGVSGSISATATQQNATALLINAGSTVETLYNSGTISAVVGSDDNGGTATAIKDLSGTLTSVTNTGHITATGNGLDTTVALDLSANTSGVTITQYLNDDDAESRQDYADDNDGDTDPTVYAKIKGDILLGSGNDTVSSSTGQIIGDTYFSTGADTLTLTSDAYYKGDVYFDADSSAEDKVNLSGTAFYTGTMDFDGGAATVTVNTGASYFGQFANADNVVVNVTGGTLIPNKAVTTNVGTVNVSSTGTIGVYIDANGNSSVINANNATIDAGASVSAVIKSLNIVDGTTYTVLTSDNLTVGGTLNSSVNTPYIYKGVVSYDENSVDLTISRKTTSELGLTRGQASAWDAIYATAKNDDDMTESLLDVTNGSDLRDQVSDLLPDHAGGIFHAVTMADRLVSRHISDETSLFSISNTAGWFEPIYFRSSKDTTGSASYKISGWGLSLGGEKRTSIGDIGVSYAYVKSKVNNDHGSGVVKIGQHDFGLFWRKQKGPLLAYARVGGSKLSMDSARTYTGTIDDDDDDTLVDDDFSYKSTAKWSGWLASGLLGASYKLQMSRRFALKPKVELEQMWLKEKGYEEESSTSDSMPLTVAKRTSSALSVSPTVTASYSLGTLSPDWRPLTFQFEGGRRQPLAGHLGKTTAFFNGGEDNPVGSAFTISPDKLNGAWTGELSMLAGGYDFTWKLSARAERTSSSTDFSGRASISVAF